MLTQLLERLPIRAALRETIFVRAFGFTKIPLLFFLSPEVLELTDERCAIKIRLSRRSRNHLGSMYFGSMCAGADLAGGLQAMRLIKSSGKKVSLIFKDFHADFLKRAEGDVVFSCEQGADVKRLVAQALETGERQNLKVRIKAAVGDEPVAWFDLTLSLKRPASALP